ncbi:MAG: hypothetical protein JJU00_14660 [Opitutales bacterium]|nr:hypothetical protein [Opitutales bacterium]
MRTCGHKHALRPEAGFTLLELVVAAALMAGLLILIFQIVGAVLNPWTRETDRVSAALQADAALDALAADVQSAAGGAGRGVLVIPDDLASGAPLRILRREAGGDLSVAAYWLDTWTTGAGDAVPSLFSAVLPPEETWTALLADSGETLEVLGSGDFPPAATDTLLAAGVVDFEVAAYLREGGVPVRAAPVAGDSGGLRFPRESADGGGERAMPAFLDIRLRILSNADLERLAALRAGSAEFPEQTEAEIHERFGTWFQRRVRLPSAQ